MIGLMGMRFGVGSGMREGVKLEIGAVAVVMTVFVTRFDSVGTIWIWG